MLEVPNPNIEAAYSSTPGNGDLAQTGPAGTNVPGLSVCGWHSDDAMASLGGTPNRQQDVAVLDIGAPSVEGPGGTHSAPTFTRFEPHLSDSEPTRLHSGSLIGNSSVNRLAPLTPEQAFDLNALLSSQSSLAAFVKAEENRIETARILREGGLRTQTPVRELPEHAGSQGTGFSNSAQGCSVVSSSFSPAAGYMCLGSQGQLGIDGPFLHRSTGDHQPQFHNSAASIQFSEPMANAGLFETIWLHDKPDEAGVDPGNCVTNASAVGENSTLGPHGEPSPEHLLGHPAPDQLEAVANKQNANVLRPLSPSTRNVMGTTENAINVGQQDVDEQGVVGTAVHDSVYTTTEHEKGDGDESGDSGGSGDPGEDTVPDDNESFKYYKTMAEKLWQGQDGPEQDGAMPKSAQQAATVVRAALDALVARRNELQELDASLSDMTAARKEHKRSRRHPHLPTLSALRSEKDAVRRSLNFYATAIAALGESCPEASRKRGRGDVDVDSGSAEGTSSNKMLKTVALEAKETNLVDRVVPYISGILRVPDSLTDSELNSLGQVYLSRILDRPCPPRDISTILGVRDQWPKGVAMPRVIEELILVAVESADAALRLEVKEVRLVDRQVPYISGVLRLPSSLTGPQLKSIGQVYLARALDRPGSPHDISAVLGVRDKWPTGVAMPSAIEAAISTAEEQVAHGV